MRFANREDAGRMLATRLEGLRDGIVVLGLTRGGIPVAFEVARRLGAPLDLVVTRRIRAGGAEEPAVGAIAEGGVTFVNPTVLREGRVTHEEVLRLADEAVADLAARMRLYRGEIPAPSLEGRTVVIVDDFVATGTTARAAARAARKRGAVRVVLAVPVMAAAVEPELRQDFDVVIALELPSGPRPLSSLYEQFEEITDASALAYLRRAVLPRLGMDTAHASPT
jgi:putative phosphoribosyl transferase